MNILELGYDRYILRDELEMEDLLCLLDLLKNARSGISGKPIDVVVGLRNPQLNEPNETTPEASES